MLNNSNIDQALVQKVEALIEENTDLRVYCGQLEIENKLMKMRKRFKKDCVS
jgi:uncharacterized phage-like protein YoqJ